MGGDEYEEHDDEWARGVLDRLDDGVREADELREGMAFQMYRLAQDLPAVFDGEWSPSAHALGTADCDRPLVLGDGIETVFDLVQHETRLLVRVVADHLTGLATLIDDEEATLAPITLCRTAYETSLRAESLIDVRDDWQKRTQRALTRRLARLHVDRRQRDYFGEPDDDDPEVDRDRLAIHEQEQRVRAFADAEGWPIREGSPYEPPFVSKEKKRETTQELAKRLFDGSDLGGFLWHATSAVGHGNVSSDIADWLDIFDPKHLSSGASLWWLAQQTVPAVLAPVALLASFQEYAGHDVDAFAGALACRELWVNAGRLR